MAYTTACTTVQAVIFVLITVLHCCCCASADANINITLVILKICIILFIVHVFCFVALQGSLTVIALDEMGHRIDDLEKNIAELMTYSDEANKYSASA